jgi:hypothetical protein
MQQFMRGWTHASKLSLKVPRPQSALQNVEAVKLLKIHRPSSIDV